MKQLRMNRPLCLLYSAAMVLDVEPEILIEEIGHDGMRVVWGDLPQPRCYRSHHIQEIQDCAIRRGKFFAPVEANPLIGHPNTQPISIYPPGKCEERMLTILHNRRAILIAPGHAAAWDGESVYDPNGYKRDLESFPLLEAWILI